MTAEVMRKVKKQSSNNISIIITMFTTFTSVIASIVLIRTSINIIEAVMLQQPRSASMPPLFPSPRNAKRYSWIAVQELKLNYSGS